MQNTATFADQEEYLRVLHIGETAFGYYQIQRTKPNELDYTLWLNQLPEHQKALYQSLGFGDCRNAPDFKCFFRALLNKEMAAYMQQHLSAEDYELWLLKRHTPCQF